LWGGTLRIDMSHYTLRRRLRAACLLVLAAAGLWATSCRRDPLPNIVWIVIDAQRADRLGAYGYDRDTSPVIDALAERGVLFENAMSQESYTHASVPSYFTSTYPLTHRVIYDHPTMDVLDDSFDTVAEILRDVGYQTSAVVFNPHLQAKFGFAQGFDLYDDAPEGWEKGERQHSNYETASTIHDKVEAIVEAAVDQPRFLYLHYLDVHDPYMPPPPFHAMFFPEGRDPVVDVLYPEAGNLRLDRYPRLVRSQYDGGVRYTDTAIASLVTMLAGHGLTHENTLWIVTSDHGEEFFDRHPDDRGGTYHGRTLYREQLHVPLIFVLPRDEHAGTRIHSPVGLVDIVPTLVDYLGMDVTRFDQFQGRSLLPMIRSGTEKDTLLYSGGNNHRAALISGRYKFYRNDRRLKANRRANFKQPEEPTVYDFEDELYDIQADPGETVNVIDDHPEVLSRFEEDLKRITIELSRRKRFTSSDMDENTRRQLEALGYIEPP